MYVHKEIQKYVGENKKTFILYYNYIINVQIITHKFAVCLFGNKKNIRTFVIPGFTNI